MLCWIVFIILLPWTHLRTDILYVGSMKHVSAFRPSGIVHAPSTSLLFSWHWPIFMGVCILCCQLFTYYCNALVLAVLVILFVKSPWKFKQNTLSESYFYIKGVLWFLIACTRMHRDRYGMIHLVTRTFSQTWRQYWRHLRPTLEFRLKFRWRSLGQAFLWSIC
jgi:hypothetical protein